MSTAIIDLSSIGYLAGTLQRDPRAITKAAQTMGLEPSRINGIPHFTAEQVELLADYFRNKKGSTK